PVDDASIGKEPAYHDFEVAPPRRVDVEIFRIFAPLDQVTSCLAPCRNSACRRNLVGRNIVAKHQHRMTCKALQRLARLERGKRGLAQIGGILREWIERSERRLHALPKLAVCGSSKRITIVGRLAPLQIGSLDLIRSWPEIAQIDVAPIGGLTQRIVLDVDIDRTCDRIGNDEGWRCKETGREQRMNPAREI